MAHTHMFFRHTPPTSPPWRPSAYCARGHCERAIVMRRNGSPLSVASWEEPRARLVALGASLHHRRKAMRMSQAAAAAGAGIDRAYVSTIEAGQRNPTIGVLWML